MNKHHLAKLREQAVALAAARLQQAIDAEELTVDQAIEIIRLDVDLDRLIREKGIGEGTPVAGNRIGRKAAG